MSSDTTLDPLYYERKFIKRKKARVLPQAEVARELALLESAQVEFPPGALQPILDSCLAFEDKEMCKRALKLLPRIGGGDILQFTGLLVWLGKAGFLEETFFILDKMIEAGFKPTMFSLAKLVSSFGQNGKIDPVFRLYEIAKKHAITFDVVTFHGMIVACGRVGNLEKALQVFDMMARDGVEPNASTFFELIMAAIRAGQPERGFDIYAGMKQHFSHLQPNVYVFTSLINAACAMKRIALAEQCLAEMRAANIKGDVFIYSSMLNAYGRVRDFDKMWKTCETMKKEGIIPNLVTFGTISKICRAAGNEEGMIRLFEELREAGMKPDGVIFGNCALLYLNKRDPTMAFEVVQVMIEEGIFPDESLFEAFERAGNTDPQILAVLRKYRQEGRLNVKNQT